MSEVAIPPKILRLLPANIPQEIMTLKSWVLWKYQWKPSTKKWDKPPYGAESTSATFKLVHGILAIGNAKRFVEEIHGDVLGTAHQLVVSRVSCARSERENPLHPESGEVAW